MGTGGGAIAEEEADADCDGKEVIGGPDVFIAGCCTLLMVAAGKALVVVPPWTLVGGPICF